MKRPLGNLVHCRSGAAALEAAIILPIVAGILMAALDFSNGWLTKLQLEQAAQRGIELVAARKGVATSYEYARTEMINAWGGNYTSATVEAWLECGGTAQASLTANCAGAQRARYVKLRIAATFNPMFGWGILYDGPDSGGTATLVGDAVVRVQ
jgi:Flp pilus assembly protein TadG